MTDMPHTLYGTVQDQMLFCSIFGMYVTLIVHDYNNKMFVHVISTMY